MVFICNSGVGRWVGLSRGLQVTYREGKGDLRYYCGTVSSTGRPSLESLPHPLTGPQKHPTTSLCIFYLVFSPFYLIQLSSAPLLQPRSSATVKFNHLFPDVVVLNALCYTFSLDLVGRKIQKQAVGSTLHVNSTLEIPSPTPLPMAGQRQGSWSFQVVKGPK